MVAFEVNEHTPRLRFLASLSDGRTVIQDDLSGQPHAWHRLGQFLKDNPGVKITMLRLQLVEGGGVREWSTPPQQPGYIYGFKGQAIFGAAQSHAVGIGYYDGVTCLINWIKLPDMRESYYEEQTREKCGFKLISNE
jgi:hypothetical protein